jgi:D-arabinose 1-dehydrogenase-like Zn-dependent alcohol dehydrogenase
LLNHKNAASFHITALVRAAEKAEKLKTLGVNAVIGSHADAALVEELASKADVIFSTVCETSSSNPQHG